MKTTISNKKSNLKINEVLNLVFAEYVNNALVNSSDPFNDGIGVADIKDIQKKNQYAEVISVDNAGVTTAKLPDGKVIAISARTSNVAIYPKVGTGIDVGYDSDGNPFIARALFVDKYTAEAGNSGISFKNEGDSTLTDLGGLIIIQKLVDKLNDLVQQINDLKDTFNNHIHITTATVGASTAPGTIQAPVSKGKAATVFDQDDFENKQVNHYGKE